MTTTTTKALETMTCGRCGGSGHHSYCQRYGTTCFGCGGSGRKYTKRGQAAADYMNALLSRPAAELQPGMKIRDTVIMMGGSVGTGWYTVESVTVTSPWRVTLVCSGHGGLTSEVEPDRVFRVAATAEEKQAARAKAIAYQETLTKAGTPRKTRKEATR